MNIDDHIASSIQQAQWVPAAQPANKQVLNIPLHTRNNQAMYFAQPWPPRYHASTSS